MDSPSPPPQHPALLPPGTRVGAWRVVAWAGQGVYGAVYRAVPAQQEHGAPVALKLALLPEDPRFAREAHLLSRLSHPHVPCLVEHGLWRSAAGARYPFLARQWVDGVPLYEQVRQQAASSQQVRGWLAQLARALAALHALGAVHRDVKGDNVLVRRSDGHAFLTDFGTGTYPGASTLTPPTFHPGTPAYRSPESSLFELNALRDRSARYHAGPGEKVAHQMWLKPPPWSRRFATPTPSTCAPDCRWVAP